jgi:hypothetical protein
VFTVTTNELGELKSIRIGHDDSGIGPDWFLDGVKIKNERTGKEYTFGCGKWLSSSRSNAQLIRDLVPTGGEFTTDITTYRVTVKTGDLRGSGTDANILKCLCNT